MYLEVPHKPVCSVLKILSQIFDPEFKIVRTAPWNATTSTKQFEYVIVSLLRQKKYCFWKVKFIDLFAMEYRVLCGKKSYDVAVIKLLLLKKFSVRSKFKLLCMQKL